MHLIKKKTNYKVKIEQREKEGERIKLMEDKKWVIQENLGKCAWNSLI